MFLERGGKFRMWTFWEVGNILKKKHSDKYFFQKVIFQNVSTFVKVRTCLVMSEK